MAPRNSKERLISYMVELRKHCLKCYECKAALKSSNSGMVCATGMLLTMSAAKEFNGVIELRRKALSHGDGIIYACPDIHKHGEAYGLTAPLFTVVATQEGLF